MSIEQNPSVVQFASSEAPLGYPNWKKCVMCAEKGLCREIWFNRFRYSYICEGCDL